MSDPQPNPTDIEPAPDGAVSANDRQWGMFAHLSALLGFVIPFGNLIGPLVIWQMKKDVPFVADQGKEALNFQITVAIAAMICVVLFLVVIGGPLLMLVGLAALVFMVIAAIKANEGIRYRYPYAFRFVE
ncbi:MAG: DUF4870 domain-containing protein [Pseudomonadales bacterium]